MKKILVAIDFGRSGGNEKVIQTAQAIAGVMDGELFLMHAIEPVPRHVLPEIPESLLGKQKLNAEKEMRELKDRFECNNGVIREGPASPEILNYAEEIGADVIVLHSHDPDITNYLLGSVAGRVVRHAHCSVHIVREANNQK